MVDSMIVYDLKYSDHTDITPVDSTIGLQCWRFVRGLKDEPEGLFKVNRKLSLAISAEFMTFMVGERCNHAQRLGRTKIV